MTAALVLLESGLLFGAVSTAILVWGRPYFLDWRDLTAVLGQALVVCFCCVVSFYYNDFYDFRIVRRFVDFAARLLQSFGVAFVLLALFYVLFPEAGIAEGPFASSLLIIIGLLLPLRAVSYAFMRSRPFMERVLILGTGALTRPLIREIENHPDIRWAIVGVVDGGVVADEPPSGHPVLGPLERIDKILEEVRVDRIIVTLTERRARLPLAPLLEARRRGVVVENGTDVYERLTGTLPLESLTPGVLVFSDAFRKSPLADMTTRAISIIASLIGLVCSAPLLGLIALAIKLDSAGPVLFVHERVGMGGTPFKLLKFRTMRAATAGTSEWVRDNSERITHVGKWLRKFRLDELPQFVNIVRGDMNLVGPRPHPVSNLELFNEKIPYYTFRYAVRPGVTGWAQVRYGYANTLAEEIGKMRYDLYYVKHRSLWFDLRILVDTVKIVLFGRGSRAADAYPAGLGERHALPSLERIADQRRRSPVKNVTVK